MSREGAPRFESEPRRSDSVPVGNEALNGWKKRLYRKGEGLGHRIETGHGIESRPEREPGVKVEHAPDERSARQRRIGEAFSAYGSALLASGVITDLEVAQRHDTHAFYRLASNPDVVVHVQGYPGFSKDKSMTIWARRMDYKTMRAMRAEAEARGVDIVGNEHEATINLEDRFPQMEVKYTPRSLGNALGALSPELALPAGRPRR